jgi:hypothetical protein
MLLIAVEVASVLSAVLPAIQAWIAQPDARTLEAVIEDALIAAFPSPLAADSVAALFTLVNVAGSLGVVGGNTVEAHPGDGGKIGGAR